MKIKVELRPHIGKMNTAFGQVDIEHDQWMVFGQSDQVPKPVFLGYIGKREGSAFNGYTTYRDLPRVLKTEVVAQLESLVGWKCAAFEPSTAPVPEEAFSEEDDSEGE